jgi:hypothetical protein
MSQPLQYPRSEQLHCQPHHSRPKRSSVPLPTITPNPLMPGCAGRSLSGTFRRTVRCGGVMMTINKMREAINPSSYSLRELCWGTPGHRLHCCGTLHFNIRYSHQEEVPPVTAAVYSHRINRTQLATDFGCDGSFFQEAFIFGVSAQGAVGRFHRPPRFYLLAQGSRGEVRVNCGRGVLDASQSSSASGPCQRKQGTGAVPT